MRVRARVRDEGRCDDDDYLGIVCIVASVLYLAELHDRAMVIVLMFQCTSLSHRHRIGSRYGYGDGDGDGDGVGDGDN